MTRLFASLYFGLMVSLVAFFFIAHLINTYLIIDIDNIIDAENFTAEVQLLERLANHLSQVEIDELILQIGQKNQFIITPINESDIPNSIIQKLNDNQVWFDDNEYNYFRAFDPVKYYQLEEDENNRASAF